MWLNVLTRDRHVCTGQKFSLLPTLITFDYRHTNIPAALSLSLPLRLVMKLYIAGARSRFEPRRGLHNSDAIKQLV